MKKEMKNTINVIMAAIALAMGVAVIVLTTINTDVSTNDMIKMLAFAAVALGILGLNKNKGEENNEQ